MNPLFYKGLKVATGVIASISSPLKNAVEVFVFETGIELANFFRIIGRNVASIGGMRMVHIDEQHANDVEGGDFFGRWIL